MLQSITATDLESVLREIDSSNFLSLTAITDPDMNKRNNPFCTQQGRRWISHVRKVSLLWGALINVSYDNMVDSRRLKEHLAVEAKLPVSPRPKNPRAWGENEDDCPLVSHTIEGEDRLYLHVVVQGRSDFLFDNRTNRKIRGEDLEDLQPFLNERDSGYRAQGLKKPVIVKDFTLTNVAEVTANKTRYTIAPAATELNKYLPRTKPTVTRSRRRVNQASKTVQPAGGRS